MYMLSGGARVLPRLIQVLSSRSSSGCSSCTCSRRYARTSLLVCLLRLSLSSCLCPSCRLLPSGVSRARCWCGWPPGVGGGLHPLAPWRRCSPCPSASCPCSAFGGARALPHLGRARHQAQPLFRHHVLLLVVSVLGFAPLLLGTLFSTALLQYFLLTCSLLGWPVYALVQVSLVSLVIWV